MGGTVSLESSLLVVTVKTEQLSPVSNFTRPDILQIKQNEFYLNWKIRIWNFKLFIKY